MPNKRSARHSAILQAAAPALPYVVGGLVLVGAGFALVSLAKRAFFGSEEDRKQYEENLQTIQDSPGMNPDTWKQFAKLDPAQVWPPRLITSINPANFLTPLQALKAAYMLRGAFGFWGVNDDESTIKGVFQGLKNQIQASQVAYAFQYIEGSYFKQIGKAQGWPDYSEISLSWWDNAPLWDTIREQLDTDTVAYITAKIQSLPVSNYG